MSLHLEYCFSHAMSPPVWWSRPVRCLFSYWLLHCIKHHERVSIIALPRSEARFCFELGLLWEAHAHNGTPSCTGFEPRSSGLRVQRSIPLTYPAYPIASVVISVICLYRGNENVTLTLGWNVIPNAGTLPRVRGIGEKHLVFPDQYAASTSRF